MNSNQNIVLIGMMGSGKTTCGRMLAERLDRPFVDCDALIEGFTGRTISDIFSTDGEEAFRELEEAAFRGVEEADRQRFLEMFRRISANLRERES